MDEETLYHLQKVFQAKETEEEQLIRRGEMTPFGTMLPRDDTQRNVQPKPSIILPVHELTDFDKFLLTEAESHQTKKKSLKLPLKNSAPSPSKSPKSSAVKPSTSFLPDDSSGMKTFTELKAVNLSKCKVKPKLKLGSRHATGYTKKACPARGLVKNYKSDSEVSDFVMDEGDNEIVDDAANYSSDDVYIPDAKDKDNSDSSEGNNKKCELFTSVFSF